MSSIFLGYGTMHTIFKEETWDEAFGPTYIKTRVEAPCGVIRIFKRGERWIEEGHPTCFRCALKAMAS